jgi:D-glycero-D-manno-heptose 1,7-bisphosphate phosphatase
LADPGVAFLDRDGTINAKAPEGEYVRRPEDVTLLPGAADAVAALNHASVRVAVVTNQRGIALGRMAERDLTAVHKRLRALLYESSGAHLDGIFHCPHDRGVCDCRKPAPGMFRRVAEQWPGVDFERSAMIGDAVTDLEAGRALGMTTVLLAVDAPDLGAAVDRLLFPAS